MEDLTPWLTHDREITERHVADSLLQRRGSFASMRFGRCLLDAQAALHNDLSGWRLPYLRWLQAMTAWQMRQ